MEALNPLISPLDTLLSISSPKLFTWEVDILSYPNSNIIHQLAEKHGTYVHTKNTAAKALFIGTLAQFYTLSQELIKIDNCYQLGLQLQKAIDNSEPKNFVWQCGSYTLSLSKRTHIMGILNTTPDSFSDGGNYQKPDDALRQAENMLAQGADIIDIGAESSRPGASPISAAEEISRLLPILKVLLKHIPLPISIDTYKSEVARAALEIGAHIINDISGLRYDPHMACVIAEYKVPVVIMHILGTPRNMQANPVYKNLMWEIIKYLRDSIQLAESAGIAPDMIAVDPGIGFGKTLEHNLQIINRLSELTVLGKPVLIGTSRKSFIGKILNLPVEQREEGTAASLSCAILNGVHIVRVHDVEKMSRVVRITDAIRDEGQ